jgi:hypothetical protein
MKPTNGVKMKFTNAELMQRKREGKALRGLKELRGVYVKIESHDETKKRVKKYIEQLEGKK